MKFPIATAALLLFVSMGLQAAEAELQEVVISSTPLRTTVEDAIQPVVVLAGAELHRQLTGSIGETIARLPGVTGSYFGPHASRPIIRGLGGERVQVLEDSIGALDVSSLSEDHAVSIEDFLTEQLEVVKGPATLLYGSGAVGGVVNLLTRRIPETIPEGGISGAVELRGDTVMDQRAVAGRIDLGAGSVALHADVYDRRSDDFSIPGPAWSRRLQEEMQALDTDAASPRDSVLNTDSRTRGGALGASLIGDRGLLGVGASRYETNYGVPLAPDEDPLAGGRRIDMQQDRLDLKAQLNGNGDWLQAVRVRAAHNDYEHAELEASGDIGTQFLQQATELRAAADYTFGSLEGTVGAQARRLDFEAIGDESFVPPSLTESTGLFVFQRYQLDAVTLEGGLRAERQSIDPSAASGFASQSGTALSGSLGALWKRSSELSLAVNLSHSQRHPTATELYAHGPHEATGQFIIGDPGIGKETANTLDLVLRGGSVATWQISAWLSRFDDFIFLQPTGDADDGLPVYEYRQGGATLHGAEMELSAGVYQRGSGELRLRMTSDLVRGSLSNGGPLPAIPPLRAGLELRWTDAQWNAGLSAFRYGNQRRVAANEVPTDGYLMIDADFTFEQALANGHIDWFIRGSNLADVEARRHTSPLKEYVPLPGRSLTAGLRWQF
jgi:iron complex outermembrane receptor protein